MRGAVRRVRRALARREFPVVPPHIGRLDYGSEVLIGVTSRAEILSRLRPVAKEPWTVRWLEENVRDGDVIYDIGANVGAYSLIAAALGRGARIVAIEPHYASYAALCDNVLLNGREDVLTPLPILLGEATGLVTLGLCDVAAGAAEHRSGDAAYRQPTLSFRLDDLLDQLGLPAPTLVKIDVDGAEAAVVAGGTTTLARPELRSVIVEIERSGGDTVVAALERAGLSLVERVDERNEQPLAHVWYGVFAR
jgi:FkbM family methyltransferase